MALPPGGMSPVGHRNSGDPPTETLPFPPLLLMRPLHLLPWLGLPLAGCVTSTTTVGAAQTEAALLAVIPAEGAWVVEDEDSFIGSVVRFADQEATDEFIFMVRNPWDQDVGMIDHLGRCWKRIPHAEDAWLSTGTVLEGVRQLLDSGDGTRMTEIPVPQLEARTRAERARLPGGIGG